MATRRPQSAATAARASSLAWAVCAVLASQGCSAPAETAGPDAALLRKGLPATPPLPPEGLPVAPFDVTWELPQQRASVRSADPLVSRMRRYDRVQTVVAPGVADFGVVEEVVRGWHPHARHSFASTSERDALRDGVVTDVDLSTLDGSAFDAEWLEEASGAAAATLILMPAPLDTNAWSRQPARQRGSCDALNERLGEGQERTLATLEPFLDQAEVVLFEIYRRRVAEPAKRLVAELSEKAGESCAVEVRQVATVVGCRATDACLLRPRVILQGEAQVVSPRFDLQWSPQCRASLGDDVIAPLEDVTLAAVREALDLLDRRWSALAGRAATLSEVHAAAHDACAPRRRRVAESDARELRRRLSDMGAMYRIEESPLRTAGWRTAPAWSAELRLPGLGTVRRLAHFVDGSGSVASRIRDEARRFREFALGASRCEVPSGSLPTLAVLIDAARAEVLEADYLFAEEWFCEGVPALRQGASADLSRGTGDPR